MMMPALAPYPPLVWQNASQLRLEPVITEKSRGLFIGLQPGWLPAMADFLPGSLKREEREILSLAFDYRILYSFKVYPIETMLAWKGACWCSDAPLGSFPYGPGPDDPSLSASVIRRFFNAHSTLLTRISPPGRKLALADENRLNAHCLVLGMFETVVRKGLFNAHSLPLFTRRPLGAADLSAAANEKSIREMTRLSQRFSSEFREMEVDILRILEGKRRIPSDSPILHLYGFPQTGYSG